MAVPNEELPRERIESIATAYEGRAMGLAQDQEGAEGRPLADALLDPEDRQLILGSSFFIAGSYWSLIDGKHARTAFAAAAESLPHDNPAAVIAASIADVEMKPPGDVPRDLGELPPQWQVFATMMIVALHDREGEAYRVIERVRSFAALPIGRLGVPASYYLNLATELMELRRRRIDDFEELPRTLTSLLLRADEVVAVARRDHYHWSRLRSRILPAEPELILASIALLRTRPEARLPLGGIMPEFAAPLLAAIRIEESR